MNFKNRKVKAKAYSKYPRDEEVTTPIKKTHGVTKKSGRATFKKTSKRMKSGV